MKKMYLVFVSILITSVSFSQGTHQAYTQKSQHKIKVDGNSGNKILKEVEQGNAYLIDVRTPEEFSERHLKNAQNINIKSPDFAARMSKLDKRKTVYLYCRSGNRSGQATDSLINLGYKSAYNIGGIDSIASKGFPTGSKQAITLH